MPAWLEAQLVATRCLAPLGVHEGCEHVRPAPSFASLGRWHEPHWAITDPDTGELMDTAAAARAVRPV